MPFTPSVPLINSNRFDFSHVKIKLFNKLYVGIHAIDYSAEVSPGFVYGQSTPYPIGRTRGQLKTDSGSIEIYREEFGDLSNDIQVIGVGLFEANFIVTVSIGDPLSPSSGAPQVDTIIGCRFSRFTAGWRQGPDALTVKLDFTYMNVLLNDVPVLSAATIPIR
jgi:hypothetical protein